MSNTVKINVINQSNDDNANVVIFQKNDAIGLDDFAVAWNVIQNLGRGDNHPFTYSTGYSVSVSDSYGNYTPQLDARHGDLYRMEKRQSGDTLTYMGASTSPKEIQVANSLSQGAINAGIYKDGKLLAIKTDIAPGQKAVFGFKPTIWIGVVSQVEEGTVMNSAIISEVNTELSLLGIASADIVMTGGGVGSAATPYKFTLENVVKG